MDEKQLYQANLDITQKIDKQLSDVKAWDEKHAICTMDYICRLVKLLPNVVVDYIDEEQQEVSLFASRDVLAFLSHHDFFDTVCHFNHMIVGLTEPDSR